MLVMKLSFVRLVLSVLLIAFAWSVIFFACGLAAWIWLAFGPGPG